MQLSSTMPINCSNCYTITQNRELCHIEKIFLRWSETNSFGLRLTPSKNYIENESNQRRTKEHDKSKHNVLRIMLCCACDCSMWIRRFLTFRYSHMISIERCEQHGREINPYQMIQIEFSQNHSYFRVYLILLLQKLLIIIQILKMNAIDPHEPEIITKKMILTIKGQLEITQTSSLEILCHEALHPVTSKISTKPITLETINYHRNNLFTLQNTSVTPTLIEHEILNWLGQKKSKSGNLMIIDSSSVGLTQKTPEVFRKYHVIRGFLYQVPSAILSTNLQQISKQSQALLSLEHISKEIQYTFGIISQQQRGFIGQIDLPNYMQMSQTYKFFKPAITNIMSCYQQYSIRNGCPLFVNLLKNGFNGYSYDISLQNTINANVSLEKIVAFLLATCNTNKQSYRTTIIINPLIDIQSQMRGKQIYSFNKNENLIQELYQQGFNLCFDLSRYQNQLCISWICQYILQYPEQTIISFGLRYKTDSTQFAGQGLLMQSSYSHISRILGSKYEILMNKVTKQNIFKLLNWYTKRIVKVQVKIWKCMKCGKQSPETIESFRKFGKDFCSVDCVRAYKF